MASRLGDLRAYLEGRTVALHDERKALAERRQQLSGWRMFEYTPEEESQLAEIEKNDAIAWGKIHEIESIVAKINQLAVHGFNDTDAATRGA